MKEIEISIRPEDIPDPSFRPVFDRISLALRAIRDGINDIHGLVKTVRYNFPPTSPAHAAALPTASLEFLGQILQLDKNGAADDQAWVCRRKTGGTYEWVRIDAAAAAGGSGPHFLDWARW